ncbi:MAG: hypothetical protein K8R56_06100 [Candidatus Eisenbacteria bacterium]|nr:hypothetical protein [Candidatus Eisenbacteria bacterium]
MHLLEAWTSLGPFHLARLLALPGAMLVAVLLPGRTLARGAALVGGAGVLLLAELAVPWWTRTLWVLLWLVIAWQAGRPDPADAAAAPTRRRGVEAGAVALPLGLALLALMLAAVWRQTFEPDDARRASLGALLVGLGLLHLMMRRHVRRAVLAVGALGVGLELLTASARAADVVHEGAPAGTAWLATLLVLLLVVRVADGRARYAGSVFVSDAHELQD